MKKIIVVWLSMILLFSGNAYAWIDYNITTTQNIIKDDLRIIDTYDNYIFTADRASVYVYSKNDVDKQLMSFGSSAVQSMAVFKDYLIVGYPDEIYIYDAKSVINGDFEVVKHYNIGVEKFWLCNEILVVLSNKNVRLYSLSDLENGFVEEVSITELNVTNIFADNEYLFSVQDSTISVYDLEILINNGTVTDSYISEFERPTYEEGAYLAIADIDVSNGYVFLSTNTATVATYKNGIFCFDLATGDYVSKYSPRKDAIGTRATNLEAINNILIASCQDCRDIKILDISKQDNIQVLSNIKVNESIYGYNFKYENNALYICSRTDGIQIVDIMPTYISELNIYNGDVRVGQLKVGESYNAKVSIESYENRDVNGKLLLAVYKDDSLKKALITDVKVEAGAGKSEFSTAYVKLEEGEALKAFFWDSLIGLVPYKNAVEASDEEFDVIYDIYVDAINGNDNNSGEEYSPFKTIERAKREVRKYNKYADADITVWIASGEYALTESIVFAEEDSGYNGNKVIYCASGNAKPVISGGIVVDDWQLENSDKNIYCAYAPNATNRQLFVDGVRATRARSKGNVIGFVNDGGKEGFTCENTEFLSYSDFADVEFVFAENWVSRRSHPTDISDNGDGTVFVALDKWDGINDKDYKMPESVLYYENAYELLDEPGEFYVNDGYVYYIPLEGKNIYESKVISPICEELINVCGENSMSHAENIVFDGLTFKYTTWLSPNENQFVDTQNLYPENPAAAVNVENANDIDFTNCIFSNMGADGLSIKRTAKNIDIIGNHFYDFSSRAISIGDWEGSHYTNDNTEIAENIMISNNSIHDVGKEYYGATAISGVWIKDVSVLHNEIYNTPYSGIHFGWGWDAYARTNLEGIDISYNYIHDFMQMLIDGGAIYFLGATNCDADNMNTVSYNYLKNGSNGAVIYCDQGSEFYHIFGNVVDNSEFEKNGWYIAIRGTSYAENNYSATPNSVGDEIRSEIICENGNFPDEARSIIRNAGIETEYSQLVNEEYLYYDEAYDVLETSISNGVILHADSRIFVQNYDSKLSEYNVALKSYTGNEINVDGIIKQAVYINGIIVVYSEKNSNGIFTIFDDSLTKVSTVNTDGGQNIYSYNNMIYAVGNDGLKLYSVSAVGLSETHKFSDVTGNGIKVYENGVFVEKDGIISRYQLEMGGKNNVIIEGEDADIAGQAVSLWISDKITGEPVYVKKIVADETGYYKFETNINKNIDCIVKMNIGGTYYETELMETKNIKVDGISIQKEPEKYLLEINGESQTDVYVMVAAKNSDNIYYIKKIVPDNGQYTHTFRITDEISNDAEIVISRNSDTKRHNIKSMLIGNDLPFNVSVTSASGQEAAILQGKADLTEYGVKTFDVTDNVLNVYTKYAYGKSGKYAVEFDLNDLEDGIYTNDESSFDYANIINSVMSRRSERLYAESNSYYFKVSGTAVDVYDKQTDELLSSIRKQILSLDKYYTVTSITVRNEKLFIYYAQTSGYGNQTVSVYDIATITETMSPEAVRGLNTNQGEVFSNSDYIFISSDYSDCIMIYTYDTDKKSLVMVGNISVYGSVSYADDEFVYVLKDGAIKIYSLRSVGNGMNKSYIGSIPANYSILIKNSKNAYTGDAYKIIYNDNEYEINAAMSIVKCNGEIIQKTYGINEDILMIINDGYLYLWEKGQKIYVYDVK